MKRMRERSGFVWAVVVVLGVTLLAGESALAGRLVAWGQNIEGQCDVPSGTDFVAISAQWKHSLALRADGSIAAWGQNNWDQSEPPAGTDFVAVAAGFTHSLALKSDGSIVAWGYNVNGECDAPTTRDFVAISGGHDHSLALRANGTIAAWGANDSGQCNAPGGNDFVAIAAGYDFSVALRADGSLAVWGRGVCESMPGWTGPCRPNPSGGNEPKCTTRALGRAEEIIELTVTDNDSLTTSDTLTIFNRMLQDLRDQIDGL